MACLLGSGAGADAVGPAVLGDCAGGVSMATRSATGGRGALEGAAAVGPVAGAPAEGPAQPCAGCLKLQEGFTCLQACRCK